MLMFKFFFFSLMASSDVFLLGQWPKQAAGHPLRMRPLQLLHFSLFPFSPPPPPLSLSLSLPPIHFPFTPGCAIFSFFFSQTLLLLFLFCFKFVCIAAELLCSAQTIVCWKYVDLIWSFTFFFVLLAVYISRMPWTSTRFFFSFAK